MHLSKADINTSSQLKTHRSKLMAFQWHLNMFCGQIIVNTTYITVTFILAGKQVERRLALTQKSRMPVSHGISNKTH